MGDFVGYNGSSIFVTHPKTVFEDGYFGVGSDGYTIVSYSSSTQPVTLTSLPPNSLIKSITHTPTGVFVFTFKQQFPRLLYAVCHSVCPSGSSPSTLGVQDQGDTIGQSTAASPVSPTYTVLVNSAGTAHELVANGGMRFFFVFQNASVY